MKKCMRRGDPQRRSYWEGVIRRWREGGQAARAFCQAEGVRESAFYFWRRKLAADSDSSDTGNGRRRRTGPLTPISRASAVANSLASFLPVQVVDPTMPERRPGVEIVLEQGRRTIRVQAGCDRQTLADVLAILEVRPC